MLHSPSLNCGLVFTGRVVFGAAASINRVPVPKAQVTIQQVAYAGAAIAIQDLAGSGQAMLSSMTDNDGFFHITGQITPTSASGLGNAPLQLTFTVGEGDPVRKANGTARFTTKQFTGNLIAVVALNTLAEGMVPTLAKPQDAGTFSTDLWTGFRSIGLSQLPGVGAANPDYYARFSSRQVIINT